MEMFWLIKIQSKNKAHEHRDNEIIKFPHTSPFETVLRNYEINKKRVFDYSQT